MCSEEAIEITALAGESETRRLRQELSQIAQALAHDLKAPLRAIEGFSEALVEDWSDRLDPAAREHLREISEGANRLDRLIEDLVTYARLGSDSLGSSPFDSQEVLVEDCLSTLRNAIERTGGQVELKGEFPVIVGKKRVFALLFEALIDNALKFHRPGEAPEVAIEGLESDREVVFRVADRGIGVPPDRREEVFGVFRRLHTAGEHPGVGMGLALAKKAADLHHGRIEIQAGKEGGTVIEVHLPKSVSPIEFD